MLVVSKKKIVTTIIVCLFGLVYAIPSLVSQKTFEKLPQFLQHSVSLGLELRGGSHIQLEADLKSVEKERQENIVDEARKQLRKQNIKYSRIIIIKSKMKKKILIIVDCKKEKNYHLI